MEDYKGEKNFYVPYHSCQPSGLTFQKTYFNPENLFNRMFPVFMWHLINFIY